MHRPKSEGGATAGAAAGQVLGIAGSHSKAPARKKKGAPAVGLTHQQQRKARSASASVAVGARTSELGRSEHDEVAGAAAAAAALVTMSERERSGGELRPHQPPYESLPPRSPAKTPKVCVPTLQDALDDVQVRFVLNLPEAELSSADRLFFQLEQAWWFYEDFIADAHKHLPHFKLKEFAKLLFEHCEALRPLSGKYNELFEYFRSWKGSIPTAGCILLNATMTDVVLVKCWKGKSRGLPKGKINQGEKAIDAAVREVLEETGYDARDGANEKDVLTLYLNGQQTTMYIVVGVDEDFPFETQVRKEISAIEWFPIDALPKGSFGVEPFIPRLRRWMAKTKGVRAPKNAATPEARTQSLVRVRKSRATSPDVSSAAAAAVASSMQSQPSSPAGVMSSNGNASSKKQSRKGSKGGAKGKGNAGPSSAGGDKGRAFSAPNRRGTGGAGGGHQSKAKGFDRRNRDTFGDGLEDEGSGGAGSGGGDGWDFEAMLAANERLTGRTFVYDGNPHEFGDPAHAAQAPQSCAETATSSGAPVRSEDQVAHVKQRGVGGGRQEAMMAPFAVAIESEGKGKNRNRGSDVEVDDIEGNTVGASSAKISGASEVRKGVDAVAAAATAATKATAVAKVDDTVSLTSHTMEPNACVPAAGTPCSQPVGDLCTEGGRGQGGTSGAAVAPLWGGNAPAAAAGGGAGAGADAGAGAGAGAGLFGNFKFDMRDIMSAVPQG